MVEKTCSIKTGDYVCPHRSPEEIGLVERVKRTRSPHATDLVVDWLTHSGSSYEYSGGLERLEPTDPRVVALTSPTKGKGGRPAKWSGPTRAIRVPNHLADHLIAIARQLDTPEPNNVQNPSDLSQYPKMLTSDSSTGTYRLFLKPPPDLPPAVEASIEEYCDRVFDGLTETERVFLLGRLVEELGVKVNA